MKKATSVILVFVLVLSMAVTAFAALERNSIIQEARQSINFHNKGPFDNIDFQDLGSSRTIDFPLTAEMFDWDEDDESNFAGLPVTSRHISRSDVTLRQTNRTSNYSNVVESIDIVYKKTAASGNDTTAVVQVKFKANAAGSSRRTFGVTLRLDIDGSADSKSQFVFSGSIAPLSVVDADDNDYIDISDGTIVQPTSNARNVELYLGEDVTVRRALSRNTRYSGVASADSLTSSDESIMRRYPSIDDIITITHTNLSATGNTVRIERGDNYYVYNADRTYIGRSNSRLPFSTKYYLSVRNIDMGGGSSSSSSSSSSGSSSSSQPSEPPVDIGSTSSVISRNDAVAKTRTALVSSKNASVRYLDMTAVASSTLEAMYSTARNAGGAVALVTDTMAGRAVSGRITIPTAGSSNMSGDIALGVYTNNSDVTAVKNNFTRWYSNRIAVISLGHKRAFGASVRIAAKVSLTGFNTRTLYIYSYNKSTNQFQQVTGAGAHLDANGFLQFVTPVGGEIIITDSPLKRR